jgi:hypothetical protein
MGFGIGGEGVVGAAAISDLVGLNGFLTTIEVKAVGSLLVSARLALGVAWASIF